MGVLESMMDQFVDVIQYEDTSNKMLVCKYTRKSGDNEIKQGSKVIVREGQAAIFLKGGQLADVLPPGTHTLKTENLPILSKFGAFKYGFNSPIIADVYFLSTRRFIDNKWATKTPIIKRDSEFSMARIRSFGKFAFRVVNVPVFMREVFGTKGIVLTFDIIEHLSSMVTEAFATTIGETAMSVLDLATEYRKLSVVLQQKVNQQAKSLGIEFTDVIIESVSLPDEVEKLIDEQSGIGMAKQDMATYMQYQTARAMRDASKQEGGLAGLGAGMAIGNTMAKAVEEATAPSTSVPKQEPSKAELLRELKALLDEGILTQEEFDIEKKKILGNS